MTFDYIYSDAYLNWRLGKNHPTNPVRALNTKRLLDERRVDYRLVEPRLAYGHEMHAAHDPIYVLNTVAGWNSEWGHLKRPEMGVTAQLMAGGTMTAVDRILAGETLRAFNPQGAKHHARYDSGGGFCVFNDLAMAARRFTAAGWKVAVIDWDVHQGNGTEEILLDDENVMTASVHGIYFGGLLDHDWDRHALNYHLERGAGDEEWLAAIEQMLGYAAHFEPDIVLVASGADSHATDPLGNLNVSVEGYSRAARMTRGFADRYCEGRMLVGGAGGYQPHTWTPECWAAVAAELV